MRDTFGGSAWAGSGGLGLCDGLATVLRKRSAFSWLPGNKRYGTAVRNLFHH